MATPTPTPTATPTPTPTPTPLPQLAPVFNAVRQFLVLVQTGERTGTGLVIGDGSYILTTDSVLENSRTGESYDLATVQHDDGFLATGTFVAKDPLRNLAVLRLSGSTSHPPADLGFQGLPAFAETVAIVGYSEGTTDFPPAHLGIVNVRADTDMGVRYLETDAPIGPGSGGSPLVSTQGEILGIIVNTTPLLVGDPLPGHAYALSMDDIRLTLQGWGILPS